MACSPYLDKYILLTFLITGCNASEDGGDMAGIIAGSVIACALFIAGVTGLVYCIIKSQKSHEAKKQKFLQASNDIDYRTVVVRRIPTSSRRHPPVSQMYPEPPRRHSRSFQGYPIAPGVYPPISQVYPTAPRNYPTVVGYSQYLVQYGSPMTGEGPDNMPVMSRMTTISHMPVQRPTLDGFSSYNKKRSSRGKFADDLKSKRKKRSRSRTPASRQVSAVVSPDIEAESLSGDNSPIEHNSQFILKKKEDSPYETKGEESPTPKANGPYALTSLFQQEPETSAERPEPPQTEIESYQRASTSRDNVPFSYLSQSGREDKNMFIYPPRSATPPKRTSSVRKDQSDHEDRPVTPDYDVNSLTGDEGRELAVPAYVGNRFSYAATEDLKQSSQFRTHYGIRESVKNPFGSVSKQVQFNSSSNISTRELNPGSYGSIPVAPPLP